MILLDTHIWVWWVAQPDRLPAKHRDLLARGADRVFGVSVISCWEVAKLAEYGRLKLDRPIGLWIGVPLRSRASHFATSTHRSWWSPPNCHNPFIEILPTNC